MKLAFQLAYKNLVGAGLRTWLNVIVLSFSFVLIIISNGLMDGWNEQGRRDLIEWETGNGHFLHENYDPFDPFSLFDGHGEIPENNQNLTPVLIRQASIYPEGRMVSVLLKGIDENQQTLVLPTSELSTNSSTIPAIIGKRMAKSANLKIGDEVVMRWRDKNGTFDASKIKIEAIFNNNVAAVDNGQIWISIQKLWEITGFDNQASLLIANEEYIPNNMQGWTFKSQKELLSDFEELMRMERFSSAIFYSLLLAIALLAIFDTQVLSIFRRQKEIGTYVALGMTRAQVVGLFTVEGSMYSILAMIVGCIYGIPLFIYLAKTGITIPEVSQEMAISIGDKMFPIYSVKSIIGTMFLLIIASTIVSYLPARKIAKLDPVAALKGKLQ